MKMVSQLTRQAMSRHRLLASAVCPDSPSSPPPAAEKQTVHPLYAPKTQPPAPQQSFTPPLSPVPPAPPPQRHTLYGDLMKKHDQFTERHLIRR